MRKISKSLGFLVVFLLSLAVNGFAIPVTVTYDGVDPTKVAVKNSAWAGFYKLTVDDVQLLGMCDDYATHVNISDTGWQAELYTYGDIMNGNGRWGLPVDAYNVMGYLFMQTLDKTNNYSYISDRFLIADINQAIWKVNYGSLNIGTGRANDLYTEALQKTDFTEWHGYMDILTPALGSNNQPVSQEFLIRGSGPAPVPEPATMLLLGTGLLGLAGVGRKKIKKA
jgi:hypothetical protein